AHAVLEEVPRAASPEVPSVAGAESQAGSPSSWVVPLSARSAEALRAAAESLGSWLADGPEGVTLGAIAWNAALRRTHHEHRVALVARSKPELAEALRDFAAGRPAARAVEGRAGPGRVPRVAFVCSGQGPQWWAMGRALLREEPVFRAAIERCDAIVRRLGPWSLLDELTAHEADSRIEVTAIAQPCLFALQVGLGALWASWGVRPSALVGHSVGEVAAAHLAGVLELEDAVRVIYQRGRCMERASRLGRMLAAGVSPEQAHGLIDGCAGRVALAAVNSPASVTLSGESGPLEEIARQLDVRGVFWRFLKVQYAFHSAQMDPVRDALLDALEGIRPRPATLPLFSTVSGRRIEGPELGPEYWWRNVRQTVRFADGLGHLIEEGADTVVELSPHPVLASAIAECFEQQGKRGTVLPSLRRGEDERATMLRSLGNLHAPGHPVDWTGVFGSPQRFVRLPLYAWQRERFWHEAEESRVSRLTPPAHPLLGVAQGSPQAAWEARLDLRLLPYLADHRVRQGVILPATASLELALAAGREAFGSGGYELRDVRLANPCFLAEDEPRRLRTSFDRETATVKVHTRPTQGDHEWTEHATAVISPRPLAPDDAGVAPDAVRNRCAREFSGERCYEYLKMIGLDYGPSFQGIERVWQGERESLGLVRLPGPLGPDEAAYRFHPALLDACLQVVIPADGDFDHRDGGLYLPSAIDRVELLGPPGPRVWAHARLLEKTPRRSLAEIDVYDEAGRPVARVRGLHSRRVAGGRGETIDDLFHAYQWHPRPLLPQDASPALAQAPGRWLIFADVGGLGDRLAEKLRSRGNACTLLRTGSAGIAWDQSDEHSPIRTIRPDDLPRLIESLFVPGAPAVCGVIHLWNLDAPHCDALDLPALAAAREAGLKSVVRL
ncbi:MAG: hypothetical protein QOE66_2536, partial [Chloroflexota bacterium]|nr:hypothetical protein [Chloroflexota bacterium]